jgi:hypothetical protein
MDQCRSRPASEPCQSQCVHYDVGGRARLGRPNDCFSIETSSMTAVQASFGVLEGEIAREQIRRRPQRMLHVSRRLISPRVRGADAVLAFGALLVRREPGPFAHPGASAANRAPISIRLVWHGSTRTPRIAEPLRVGPATPLRCPVATDAHRQRRKRCRQQEDFALGIDPGPLQSASFEKYAADFPLSSFTRSGAFPATHAGTAPYVAVCRLRCRQMQQLRHVRPSITQLRTRAR